jgi:hypothetical protein
MKQRPQKEKTSLGEAPNDQRRKSKQVKVTEALVTEMLAEHFGEILKVAIKLCKGVRRHRHHPITGACYYETKPDYALIRFMQNRVWPSRWKEEKAEFDKVLKRDSQAEDQ